MKLSKQICIIFVLILSASTMFGMEINKLDSNVQEFEDSASDSEQVFLERLKQSRATEYVDLAEKYPVIAQGAQILGVSNECFQEFIETKIDVFVKTDKEFQEFVTIQAQLKAEEQVTSECKSLGMVIKKLEEKIISRAFADYKDIIQLAADCSIDFDEITHPSFVYVRNYPIMFLDLEYNQLLRIFLNRIKLHENNSIDIKNLKYVLAQPGINVNSTNCMHHIVGLSGREMCCGLIHIAASLKRSDILQALIEHGANLEIKYGERYTPLHVAARCGRVENIRLLLAKNPLLIHGIYTENNYDIFYNDVLTFEKMNHDVIKELLCSNAFVRKDREDETELAQENKKRKKDA